MTPATRRLFFASALFVLSGAIALVYEVCWFRRFTHVWGSSAVALAAVVVSFLGGLGLGAWRLGRLAERARRPLLGYALLELGIGAFALLVPYETAWLASHGGPLESLLGNSPPLVTLGRTVLSFLVLGPPCFLMGGTLPFLLAFFGRGGRLLREAAGWLYAVNTLGAAGGCALAGFWLLPQFGLGVTQWIAAGASFAAGSAALAIAAVLGPAPVLEPPPEEGPESAGQDRAAGPSLAALGIAVLLSGFSALALEVVWTRRIAVLIGGSTYAFSAALAVFLLGLGIGSLLYHTVLRRRGELLNAPGLVIPALALTALAGKLLLPLLSDAVGMLRPLRANAFLDGAVTVLLSAMVELLPAIGMGLLLPLIFHLAAPRVRHAAAALGALYALNTIGAIAGVTLTGIVLIPALGTAGAFAAALGGYALVLLLVSPAARDWGSTARLFAGLSAVFAAALLGAQRADPRATDLGQYLYGFLPAEERPDEVLYFREGAHANVLVTKTHGISSLRVNGKVDASTLGDMPMQLGCAYLPLFLAPESRQALVIGYGSGTSAGALLLFDSLRVTCAEIEPCVVEGAEHFAGVNHQPLRSERFDVVYEDGRLYLARTEERFDLITSEPSNPWLAGMANLFTREFYTLARARLAEGGILAQWIQSYAFSIAEYALVARTVRDVFPHTLLVRISSGDTLLLASDRELLPDAATCDRAQQLVNSRPEVLGDLQIHFGTADVRALFLRHLLLDEYGLQRLLAQDPRVDIHTDLNLRLEFDAPRRLFARPSGDDRIDVRIRRSVAPGFHASLLARIGVSEATARASVELYRELKDVAPEEVTRAFAFAAQEAHPEDVDLAVIAVIAAGPGDEERAAELLGKLRRLSGDGALEKLARAGKELFDADCYEPAEAVLREVVRRSPTAATAWANLGSVLAELGRTKEAREALAKAVELDPLSRFARRALKSLGEPSRSEQEAPPPPEAADGPH